MLAWFSALLLFLFASPAPPPPTATPLPSIVSVAPLGSSDLLLLHEDGSFTVASMLGLEIVNAAPNAYGWPLLGTSNAVGGAGPHVFETTYNSTSGTHTVRTPCSGYTTVDDCATRHRAAVEALQRVYPRL